MNTLKAKTLAWIFAGAVTAIGGHIWKAASTPAADTCKTRVECIKEGFFSKKDQLPLSVAGAGYLTMILAGAGYFHQKEQAEKRKRTQQAAKELHAIIKRYDSEISKP